MKVNWSGSAADSPGSAATRTLGDEVALEVADWLAGLGSAFVGKAGSWLTLPPAALQGLRRGKGSTADRLVLDLDAPALLQQVGDDLHLGLRSTASQRKELQGFSSTPSNGLKASF